MGYYYYYYYYYYIIIIIIETVYLLYIVRLGYAFCSHKQMVYTIVGLGSTRPWLHWTCAGWIL